MNGEKESKVITKKEDRLQIVEKPENISYEELNELIHTAYQGWCDSGVNFGASEQTADDTKKRIDKGTCLVTMLDGRLVGTISYQAVPRSKIDICGKEAKGLYFFMLAVDPKYRSKRIATRMIQKVEQTAKEHNYDFVVADTYSKAKGLIKWYNSLGYRNYTFFRQTGRKYYSVGFKKYLSPSMGKDIWCTAHYHLSLISRL